jgi:aminoglycoside 3-N-acetyltransferase
LSELDAVQRTTGQPATISTLGSDFTSLGIKRGMVLLVHASLSSLGWVCGGASAVILALEEVLGEGGTLVMPTHSGDLTDPENWENPPVPQDWWETIRQNMPPFQPDLTPTRKTGAISETFRKQHGVLRSNHPHSSFAARGAHAAKITNDHALEHGLGENSPLARTYELDGHVLLLGVGHENNTSLHLAEYRAAFSGKRSVKGGAPIIRAGKRVWAQFDEIDLNADDFELIGKSYARDTNEIRIGNVAQASCMLMPQRGLVDYAVAWMEENRGSGTD